MAVGIPALVAATGIVCTGETSKNDVKVDCFAERSIRGKVRVVGFFNSANLDGGTRRRPSTSTERRAEIDARALKALDPARPWR